jgi:cyclic beta-1,2-glucan synthetase
MTETPSSDPEEPDPGDRRHGALHPPMVGAFVAELARRLQGRGPALALPLTWIEQRLSESGLTIEHLVQSENQQQAADQVSISNSIGSLRVLGAMDWRTFVETMSVVERTCGEDPGGVYGRMDFATRDRYRHATEKRSPGRATWPRARSPVKAVELARAAAGDAADGCGERARHVGFYLIDQGLPDLERAAAVRHSGAAALCRSAGRFPLPLYLGGIVLLSAIGGAGLLAQALAFGMPAWWLPPLGLLAAGGEPPGRGAGQLAGDAAGDAACRCPDGLLAGDTGQRAYAGGGADAARQRRERRRADRGAGGPLPGESRRAPAFRSIDRFSRRPAGIAGRRRTAAGTGRRRIDELNEKYGDGRGGDIFFLFHRPRLWNPQDRVWMAYERKRGKLAALNALLLTGTGDGFSLVVGDPRCWPTSGT